ncbi:hypothetical protein J2S70_000729 [Trueperella bonasi]|uniref:Uncharacterized protein n=1 Tax=Trueperella bonasi TaxID=312286 RepID=A0ABT9NFH8_9ACTO|nr:hypothetical protein [Trueperella bonasi]
MMSLSKLIRREPNAKAKASHNALLNAARAHEHGVRAEVLGNR